MSSLTRGSSPQTSLVAPLLRDLPLLAILGLVFGYFALTAPNFLDPINLASIGRDIAVIGMMGMGLTLVIITGGIDLSCSSILALSASVMRFECATTAASFSRCRRPWRGGTAWRGNAFSVTS